MNEYLVIVITVLYLAGLFGLAYIGERYSSRLRNHSAFIYVLSMMVYCTAWTFYGSVGRASTNGLDFLTIYLGPLVTVPLWGGVMRKMVRISRVCRISSIADFLASRYGKNARLGTLVAFVCLFGIIPYIALQLKAISESIGILVNDIDFDPSLAIISILTLFAMLFGIRNVDANQRKSGLMSVIAFESLFKLLAFLVLGVWVLYILFSGPMEIFTKARAAIDISVISSLSGEGRVTDWILTSMVSAFAFLLLPRQFHVIAVEAVKERDIKQAMRWVPIYLLLINLFVIPVALAGMVMGGTMDPDFYVLGLPLSQGNGYLALFIFLGGFAASTSMILVSTTALSTMMSNYVFTPILIGSDPRANFEKPLLWYRRISILLIMTLAYLFFHFLTQKISLVGIGMISFIAVAQLAPAFFGGMYWKKANHRAAVAGIVGGIAVWFFMLVGPEMLTQIMGFSDGEHHNIIQLWVINLADRMQVSITSATTILSLTVNISLLMYFSWSRSRSPQELNQAELFVDIYRYSRSYDSSVAWKGTAYVPDIRGLLEQFIGKERSERVLERYARSHGIDWDSDPRVDNRLVSFAERVLTGVIGPASARVMISNAVQEEDIRIADVMEILHESQATIKLNKELQLKSQQLARATDNLKRANEKLVHYDELKNEFLYTVTHELRTPITSIRAMSEILRDSPGMASEEKETFIKQIIHESERMSRLISDVLDLEKFESGHQALDLKPINLAGLIEEEMAAITSYPGSHPISINYELNPSLNIVMIDKERIRQVLSNLLSNAVKYCDQMEGYVKLTADNDGQMVTISVFNNGKGISPDDMSNIFDKFYQLKNQTKLKPSGHGLGLAICKNIVEMHGGEIKVCDKEGLVRFSFTLPATQIET